MVVRDGAACVRCTVAAGGSTLDQARAEICRTGSGRHWRRLRASSRPLAGDARPRPGPRSPRHDLSGVKEARRTAPEGSRPVGCRRRSLRHGRGVDLPQRLGEQERQRRPVLVDRQRLAEDRHVVDVARVEQVAGAEEAAERGVAGRRRVVVDGRAAAGRVRDELAIDEQLGGGAVKRAGDVVPLAVPDRARVDEARGSGTRRSCRSRRSAGRRCRR